MKKIKLKHIVTFILIAILLELVVIAWDVFSVFTDPQLKQLLSIL